MKRLGVALVAGLVLVAPASLGARPTRASSLRRLATTPRFAAAQVASVHETFTVDSGGDATTGTSCASGHAQGACTLRAAIAAADSDTGYVDEVLIPKGMQVTLTQGTLDLSNSMVIDGAGAGVNGGGSRVFDVAGGPSVQISGLEITGAATPSSDGGGIYCDTGGLVLSGVEITGNSAAYGGGVYSGYRCQLWVTGSTVSGNTATGSSDASPGYGGGLYVQGAADIEHSTIGDPTGKAGNVAANGAGVYNVGVLTVLDSEIEGNTSATEYGSGVGIYNGALLTVSGSTIALNTAPSGGEGAGVDNQDNAQLVDSSVSSNTISDAVGDSDYGAGVYGHGVQLSLNNVVLKGNSASSGGGGSLFGTAVYADDGGVSLDGVSITSTSSGSSAATDFIEGGAIYVGGQHASLNDVTIASTENTAGVSGVAGGAIYAGASSDLRDVSISDTTNSAGYVEGGAVYAEGDTTMSGDSVSSTSNQAAGNPGYIEGGVIYSNDSMSVSNTSIATTSDTASPSSGSSAGAYIEGGELYNRYELGIDGLSMSKLTATASGGSGYVAGGGIWNDDYLTAQDLQLVGANVSADAYLEGGLVFNDSYLAASDLTLGNATVSLDGTGTPYADGTILFDAGDGTEDIVNGTFDNVSSSVPSGGSGLYGIAETGLLELTNATIAADSLSGPTGNTFLLWDGTSGSRIGLRNSIVAGTTPALNCGTSSGGSIVSTGGNLDNGDSCGFTYPGDKQSSNPHMQPLAHNGGRVETAALTAGSPAINAGTNSRCPKADARGVKRPQPAGGVCDMGAYEAAAPSVQTGSAINATASGATLTATVNPDDQATKYYFEYGTSTAFGELNPKLELAGGYGEHRVSRTISGLRPHTTYHFRIVAVSGIGTSDGADRTFTTS